MKNRNSVLPQASLGDAVSRLAELDDINFKKISSLVAGEKLFDLEESEVQEISSALNISIANASFFLAALSFLYDRLENGVGKDGDRAASAKACVTDLNLFEDDEVKSNLLAERLAEVLSHNSGHDNYLKVRRLQQGFLPRAIDFSSFVDLRPSFSGERDSIDGMVSVIQLKIDTDSPVANTNSVVIQFTPSDIADLKNCLNDIESKLTLISKNRIFKDSIKLLD